MGFGRLVSWVITGAYTLENGIRSAKLQQTKAGERPNSPALHAQ
jgi:hypothetical protein